MTALLRHLTVKQSDGTLDGCIYLRCIRDENVSLEYTHLTREWDEIISTSDYFELIMFPRSSRVWFFFLENETFKHSTRLVYNRTIHVTFRTHVRRFNRFLFFNAKNKFTFSILYCIASRVE